jgi:hypothetical protein
MLYEFEITEADIGTVIGPPSGFLVSLSKVQSRTVRRYIVPNWDAGRQVWTSAYLQLRATGDVRDLVCINPAQAPAFPGQIANTSIADRGDFVVKCVPHQTSWRLVLSDAPLTAKELAEMGREQERKALEKSVIQMRADLERVEADKPQGAKSNARRAQAMMEGATRPV